MLKYNFEKNVFEGDDDMDGIDDDTNDTVDNIDDLVDADESDEDSEEPAADDFAEANMSDPCEEILFTADDDFWRRWIENREMLAQAKDSELAQRFWDERP